MKTDELKVNACEIDRYIYLIKSLTHKNQETDCQRDLNPPGRLLLLVLERLENSGLNMPSQIAREMGVSLHAITHILNALEDKELVLRTISKQDRRMVTVRLTSKGRQAAHDIHNCQMEKLYKLIEFLGEEDTKALIKLLKRIAEFYTE